MNFQDLHERLRLELLRRIEQGALSGTRLAQQTGFRQAHISNFLNRRRALSLEGLDRVLTAQGIAIDHLLPIEIAASITRPSSEPHRDTDRLPSSMDDSVALDGCETVPVITLSAAAEEVHVKPADVIETIHVSATYLAGSRPRASRRYAGWQRFVAVRPNGHEAEAMYPVFAAGAVAVIDRHYNSIAPYRADRSTLLAIRYGSSLLLRFVEFDGGRLILRPSSIDFPLHVLTVGANETASDYIVGRVCLVLQEL